MIDRSAKFQPTIFTRSSTRAVRKRYRGWSAGATVPVQGDGACHAYGIVAPVSLAAGKAPDRANPMHGSVVPKAGKSRERVLSDAEVIAFWKASDTVSEPVGQCLKLLLLTGCRRDELGKLRRAEISDDGTVTIPASRSKNKKSFVIPLPPLAQEILHSVQTSGDFVFASERGKPISGVVTHQG